MPVRAVVCADQHSAHSSLLCFCPGEGARGFRSRIERRASGSHGTSDNILHGVAECRKRGARGHACLTCVPA